MAEVDITATRQTETTWVLTWASSGAGTTYYVYVNGTLQTTTEALTYQVAVPVGGRAWVQVFDSSSDTPDEIYPDSISLTWNGVEGTEYYQVQQYNGSSYTAIATVYPSAFEYYEHEIRSLTHGTNYRFRVAAYGKNGVLGYPKEVRGLMVTRPATPDVTYTYDDETQTVTVATA